MSPFVSGGVLGLVCAAIVALIGLLTVRRRTSHNSALHALASEFALDCVRGVLGVVSALAALAGFVSAFIVGQYAVFFGWLLAYVAGVGAYFFLRYVVVRK